jgi:hypothetical protein
MIGSASAVAWGLTAALSLLLTAAWLDLLWELSPEVRIAALFTAGGAGAVLLVVLVLMSAKAGASPRVAHRLDETAGSGGAVLTGWELDQTEVNHPAADVTAGLARLAVDRAAEVAGRVPPAAAVPAKPFGRSAASLVLVMAALGVVALCLPGLARTQWFRFTDLYGDVPPFSPVRFQVSPGDVEVLYGSPVEVRTTVTGAVVEQVELVLETEDGKHEVLPMFPERHGCWRAALAKVTEPTVYYVRAYRARSEKHRIGVITVPQIEDVRLRVTPPPYTNLGAEEGPLPTEGVAGLPGTEVRVWVRSNRPLSGGTISVRGGSDPVELEMKPTEAGGHEVVGQFTVEADGKFQLAVTDVAGQTSQEPFGGNITLLVDEHPFIRLLQPRARSLATPHVSLPVELAAEDDYGISRVELYRSLNGSRPLPVDVPVAERPPRRTHDQLYLPLADYGLVPGDVVKLFARVVDNDPAGPKGAESSVVTVQIISQEQFERMLRVEQGLEVLMSKYREAQRRLEALAAEIDGLRKKLEETSQEGPDAESTRSRLERLTRRLREESEALRNLAKNRLPYDIESELAPQLEAVARIPDEVADELAKLLEQEDLHGDALARQLKKLAERLDSGRRQFNQMATEPLELLEVVFPLIADQSRFVMLVLRQIDLAERLTTLKGREGEDNPALKTRMRDLEEEQRKIREDLGELLDDIEAHVAKLPDDDRFDRLRETAARFADEVRASGASEAMAEAENALAEFSGTRAYEKAQEAAEILKKFLKMCEKGGMGQCAGECLIFQPTLSKGLGNTVPQLLAGMGLGGGVGGAGAGMAGSGGYSARRGGFGLYGGLPGMGAWGGPLGESRDANDTRKGKPAFYENRRNADEVSTFDSANVEGAGGVSPADVPLRYRRRVGQYFQRINEELPDR